MASIKMTFTLDEATAARLEEVAASQQKPKSHVVRDAIADYAERADRLSEAERRRLLVAFDELVSRIPPRPPGEVEEEIAEVRRARRASTRDHASR